MNEFNTIIEELLGLSDKVEDQTSTIGIKQRDLLQKLADMILNNDDEMQKMMVTAMLADFDYEYA